jgi:hypothetical protein
MELDTHPETKIETKRCQRCKKTFAIERFIDLDKDPDKVYAKCSDCRLKLVVKKNVCETCGIRGCFNFPEESFGRRCKKHSDLEMVDVITKFCAETSCRTRPCFNFEGQTRGLYCDKHKKIGMINVKIYRLCQEENCEKSQPKYNFKGENKGIYCNEHKKDGMIDIYRDYCEICGKRALYNLEGEKKGIYCFQHKKDGMIYLGKKKECQEENCTTIPRFNFEGAIDGVYCWIHKEDGMIDVKSPECQELGCDIKQPKFNFKGEKTGIFCRIHKKEGMIDVKRKYCIETGCQTSCKYNFKGEKEPLYCFPHKKDGMIDILSKYCQHKDCESVQPKYNFEGEKAGIYCHQHKLQGMIDIYRRICECGKTATYALPGMLPEKCAKHKSSGMINPPRKQCEADECKEFATHGIKGTVHCEQHAQTDEYLLTERNCLKCNRLDILNTQGLCVNFCSLEERDRLMKKQVKKKEEFVRKLLEAEIDVQEYVIQEWQDSIIDPTCTKRRPDFVYHCGNHIVIVEVDEDQHKSYSNCGSTREEKLAGENRRMFEIFQIFQGLPVVFIRYNPDGFRVNQKIMKVSDRIRHRILVQWIKKCLREFQPGLLVKYLYYDDFSETDIGLIQIQEKDVLV